MMDAQTKQEIIALGNICRTQIPAPDKRINLYIGNNVMGACIDALGSMEDFPDAKGIGITHVNHRRHYCKAYFGMEYKVPLLRHHFDVCLKEASLLKGDFIVKEYRQLLNISSGILQTDYTLYQEETSVASVSLTQYFSFADKTDFHCDVKVRPLVEGVEILFSVEAVNDYLTHYSFPYRGFSELTEIEGMPALKISTGITWTVVTVPVLKDARIEKDRNRICTIYPCNRECMLHLGYIAANENYSPEPRHAVSRWLNSSSSVQRNRHLARWEEFWSKGLLDIRGHERLQTIWLRSMYYLGISEPDQPDIPGTPGGLAGSKCWPFAFPQDYCFIFQAFLSGNHLEIAGATAYYWKEHLEDFVRFTKDLLHVDGAFIPWTLPNTSFKDFHAFGVPNKFSYELHNSAYAAHMCYTYYRYTKDPEYLMQVAVPVLTRIAEFYTNISTYDPQNQCYDILFTPITGQNEQSECNQPNYLCCLTSAQYSIETALEVYRLAGLEPDHAWEDIAEKKFAFKKVTVNGEMVSYEGGSTEEKVGAPVRISSLALLPIKWLYESDIVKKAYYERYSWVRGAADNIWGGWNIAELIMGGARMRDDSEMERDINALLSTSQSPYPCLDWEDVEFFETSGARTRCYFITTHGLFSAALSEMALQTFAEKCVLFPIVLQPLQEAGYGFENYLTPFGFTISARWEKGSITAQIEASRSEEVTFEFCHTDKMHGLYDQNGTLLSQSKEGLLTYHTLAGCRYHIKPIA